MGIMKARSGTVERDYDDASQDGGSRMMACILIGSIVGVLGGGTGMLLGLPLWGVLGLYSLVGAAAVLLSAVINTRLP